METMLEKARQIAKANAHLAPFEIRIDKNELHLSKDGDCFARLIATDHPGQWRMAYFHNLERWQYIDFTGSLEECLAFLADNPHYLFWEG